MHGWGVHGSCETFLRRGGSSGSGIGPALNLTVVVSKLPGTEQHQVVSTEIRLLEVTLPWLPALAGLA